MPIFSETTDCETGTGTCPEYPYPYPIAFPVAKAACSTGCHSAADFPASMRVAAQNFNGATVQAFNNYWQLTLKTQGNNTVFRHDGCGIKNPRIELMGNSTGRDWQLAFFLSGGVVRYACRNFDPREANAFSIVGVEGPCSAGSAPLVVQVLPG